MKIVFCTIPPDKARSMAQTLVTEQLVACVNVLPAVQSVYSWKGELCIEEEAMMLMKTTDEKMPVLQKRILQLHPYEVPEIVSVTIDEDASHPDYLRWVMSSVSDS